MVIADVYVSFAATTRCIPEGDLTSTGSLIHVQPGVSCMMAGVWLPLPGCTVALEPTAQNAWPRGNILNFHRGCKAVAQVLAK